MLEGGQFTVETQSNNGKVLLTLADTGVGIDEGTRDNIFDPFFTTRPDGTGLGLTLVQQIIHEHGGKIHCESNDGKGSKFVIQLEQASSA